MNTVQDLIPFNDLIDESDNGLLVATSSFTDLDDFGSDVMSDSVVQMPAGWPNIEQLLIRHSWDFTSAIHPSVNKAMSHLDLLQVALEDWYLAEKQLAAPEHLMLPSSDCGYSTNHLLARSVALPLPEPQRIVTGHPDTSLQIFGIGQKRPVAEQLPCLGHDDVIEETITLLAHLEKDRQETLVSLRSQRDLVTLLGQKIAQLAFERMVTFPVAVQREHEACASDINELNWHVVYRGRRLARLRSQVDKAQSLNTSLLEEIDHNKKHIPLVEEKLEMEKQTMQRIESEQKDTDVELKSALDQCREVTAKSNIAFAKAEQERISLKKDLDDVRSDLAQATKDLENVQNLYISYIANCRSYTETIKQQHSDLPLEIQRNATEKKREKSQKKKVENLEQKLSAAEKNFEEFELLREKLEVQLANQKEAFVNEEKALAEELESKEEAVRLLKRSNRELEMDRDALSRKIQNCDDKKISDEKNMERMQRELESTAEMIETIAKELGTVSEDHLVATEKLEKENKRCQMEEDAQKSTVDILKKTVKEELHRKMVLRGRIEADHVEFEKTQEDSKTRLELSERKVQEVKKAVDEVTKKVNDLNVQHEETKQATNTLNSKLEEKKRQKQQMILQSDTSLQELVPERDEKRDELRRFEAQHSEMVAKTDEMTKEIEGMETASVMIKRSNETAKTNVDKLQAELEELTVQLASAERLKTSLLKSLSDICARDMMLEMKHREIMVKRQEILHKLKTDLNESKNLNKSLASCYRHLQNDLIRKKTEFLRKFEERVKIENDIKDVKQMLGVQTRIHAALQHYYKYRYLYSTSELKRMKGESKNNGIQLVELHEELDRTVAKITEFLQSQLHGPQTPLIKKNVNEGSKKIDCFHGPSLPQIGTTVPG